MIISASRRTDLPSLYSDWFFNRIKEGYVLVSNPFNPKMLSRVSLSPEVVDCFVFWTKNPAPMLDKLDRLQDYKYYFQFTINSYDRDIERRLPPLSERIDTFKRFSDRIGKEKVIWRYDPVLINKKYTIAFHQEAFAQIASQLSTYTCQCMLGFIDHYRHLQNILNKNDIKPLVTEEIEKMAVSFKNTIDRYAGMALNTCTTKTDLHHLGIPAGKCIDDKLVERITGYSLATLKDKNQRAVCNCVESIDIGAYDSCLNGCIYCYANKGKENKAGNRAHKHDSDSPLLNGTVREDQIIKDREMRSLRNNQFSLF